MNRLTNLLGERKQNRSNGEVHPWSNRVRQGDEGRETREKPGVFGHSDDASVIDQLAESSYQQHSQTRTDNPRDRQQIRLDDIEAESAEREGEVLVDRILWQTEQETKSIERPHVIVFGALPDLLEREALAVVHAALLRVIADY